MRPIVRDPLLLFAPPRVECVRVNETTTLVKSPVPPRPHARCTGDWLAAWASETPERVFLRERDTGGKWREISYAGALTRAEAIAEWLLAHDLEAGRPLVVLSDNSIDHALLMLAATHVGIPVASISPAYSLMSTDHGKLKAIIALLKPGAIYVSDAAPFAPALRAVAGLHNAALIAGAGVESAPGAVSFETLLKTPATSRVTDAFARVGPETIAKILFTSGSTGDPKGVINTQRMLCASQEAKAQLWPFVEHTPPEILDWLPWSHTFGANHNFNLVLRNGGTLTVDAGKPAPGRFQPTLDNLRELSPNIYFNVPRGFDMLVAALQRDEALRHAFFARLQVIFYAGAALPQTTWDDLNALALATVGAPVAMVSAWGSTETSPLASDCHFQAERSGVIGLPVPGVEFKLLRSGDKQEIRVRGPVVTPGYWKRADLTQAAFDEEGFYRIGDAVKFIDETRPEKGLLFDGRVTEDFKLTSGTWVSVGTLRVRGLEALAPLADDIVVTGHNRAAPGFLVFPNAAACRAAAGLAGTAPITEALNHPAVVARVRDGLAMLRATGGGSSAYAARALLMNEPPCVDAGEITDKGYINQAAVLTRRAALVETLYSDDVEVLRPAD